MRLGHGVADVSVGVQPEQRGIVVKRQPADVLLVALDVRGRGLLQPNTLHYHIILY